MAFALVLSLAEILRGHVLTGFLGAGRPYLDRHAAGADGIADRRLWHGGADADPCSPGILRLAAGLAARSFWCWRAHSQGYRLLAAGPCRATLSRWFCAWCDVSRKA